MKQAHLGGRTRGLRPGQHRQLDRLSHRRHPEGSGADLLTLERMAGLVQELELSMHLVLDGRGLCRLLWLGPLQGSEALRQHLPQAPRRRSGGWRLLSCPFSRSGLHQDLAEAVIALDLNPISWLRFAPVPSRDGLRSAELLQPDRHRSAGWRTLEQGDLRILCQQDRNPGDITTQEPSPTSAGPAIEPVLLLTLTTADAGRSERELAELEGLVRSAGAQPVAVVTQRAGSANPQTLWGTGKLQEAALEVRRHGASLVVTDRELTPVQARNLERLLACPVSDRSELILDIFAQRAGSAAGRLQVELAQLRYRLPRLLGRGRSLSRQGGGIGTRGPGETQRKRTAVPSAAASIACSAISSSSRSTAADCGTNAGGCHGWPSWGTPTPANPACSMPSVVAGTAIGCWPRTNCLPPSIPQPAAWNCRGRDDDRTGC